MTQAAMKKEQINTTDTSMDESHKQLGGKEDRPKKVYPDYVIYIKFSNRQNWDIVKGVGKGFPGRLVTEGYRRGS